MVSLISFLFYYCIIWVNGNIIFQDNMYDNEDTLFYKLIILFRLIQLNTVHGSYINLIAHKIKDKFIKSDINIDNFIIINSQITELANDDLAKKVIDDIYTMENILDVKNNFSLLKDEIFIENHYNIISNQQNPSSSNKLLNLLLSELNRTNYYKDDNEEYNYFSLSSGEREYLSIFVALLHHIYRINNNSDGRNEFIFIFDEPDLGLHPNWQKQIFNDLIEYINKFAEFKVQIIITSHSPFILSDIPITNILFLENGKNITEKFKINTFGANIHTLLSHGFFMNGLMGEFAKNKINNIIDFFNDKNKLYDNKENELYKIIELIGEEFLKSKLIDMFYRKFKDEEKKEIRRNELIIKKEQIQKELDSLDG